MGGSQRADAEPILVSRTERFIEANGLLERNGSVLVGLSGGADSVALLNVLLRLSKRHGFSVCAAHFNHGIRGKDADDDELFCRDMCEELGVRFYSETADVPAYASQNGLSLETAGRLLRYEFLERVRERTGCERIATAHHMNDNAESVLLHLLRGSGLAGLLGIKPMRGRIIRPLLSVTRKEIEEYLDGEGIPFRTDETNLVPEGSRNRVRLSLIPYIEEHINPAIVPTLCGMSELLKKDEDYLMEEAESAYNACLDEGGLLRAEVDKLPYPIKTRVLRIALARAGAVVDIERVHIDALTELLSARTGARLMLPGIEARTSYEHILFGRCAPEEDFAIPLREGLISTPLGAFRVEITEDITGFMRSPTVCFIDMDKADALGEPLEIRTRREGDRFMPVGAPGKRKLKDWLIDRKVDREKRSTLPLIASGNEVLFVAGLAASEVTKVDKDTKRMLKAEYLFENQFGGIEP